MRVRSRSDEAEHCGSEEHCCGDHLHDERLLGVGGEPRVLEAKESVGDRDQKPGDGRHCEARSDEAGPDPACGDDADADHQAGNRLQQEERPDGRDGAVAIRLAPQMEVHVRGAQHEHATRHEAGGRGQTGRPADSARAAQQE